MLEVFNRSHGETSQQNRAVTQKILVKIIAFESAISNRLSTLRFFIGFKNSGNFCELRKYVLIIFL